MPPTPIHSPFIFQMEAEKLGGLSCLPRSYLNNLRDLGNTCQLYISNMSLPKVHLSSPFDSLSYMAVKRREQRLTGCSA